MRIEPPSPIELARRDRGWRQADLATEAGVSRHTVAIAERGYRPSEKSRRKIAAALGSSVAELWIEGLSDPENSDAPVRKTEATPNSGGMPRHASV
jgi:transcriptional regulator with XRE-family HTH domain